MGVHDPVDLTLPRSVIAFFEDLPAAGEIPAHSHARCQLIYAARGTLTIMTQQGSWVAPPERAVWIPAGIVHVTRYSVGTQIRTVYVSPDAAYDLPKRCAVVPVSRLLREVLLAVMQLDPLYEEDGRDGRLVQVLIDRIAATPDEPLHLPQPENPKLRELTERLLKKPEERITLSSAARHTAMSSRSFARRFRAETGMSFGAWQRQARLLRALELLGAGHGVGDVAFALGYDSESAFIVMFRRALGITPSRYFGLSFAAARRSAKRC